MRHQFKAGDVALIVGTLTAYETLGRTVELIEYLGDDRVIFLEAGGWVDNVEENRIWLVRLTDGQYTDKRGVTTSEGPCREQFLMPLRGDFEPEQQKAKEAEPCA
ncbi:hypothetical protein QEM15_004978 [Pseudomonas putida]|nr:hypothetical protein [Pseudomonas putida]